MSIHLAPLLLPFLNLLCGPLPTTPAQASFLARQDPKKSSLQDSEKMWPSPAHQELRPLPFGPQSCEILKSSPVRAFFSPGVPQPAANAACPLPSSDLTIPAASTHTLLSDATSHPPVPQTREPGSRCRQHLPQFQPPARSILPQAVTCDHLGCPGSPAPLSAPLSGVSRLGGLSSVGVTCASSS